MRVDRALLPPQLRSQLKGLRLRPRLAPGNRGVGLHPSRNRGAGLEFSQYRAYEPGDDLRQVDWKLYARSDRFFVREAERESPLTLWLLIDASASMRQADPARPDWQRLDAARVLAAAIAELALAQGDRFGLIELRETGPQHLPASTGVRERDRLWLRLQALRAEGELPGDAQLEPIWGRVQRGDLAVILSDGFDPRLIALAERLAAAGRELIFLQLLTAAERDFPFHSGHRFRDPETGAEIRGDGRALRAGYLERFGQMLAALDARLDAAGIARARHVLDEPLLQPLRQLFGHAAWA